MRLIVDARPFSEPVRGGVGRVALELVYALAAGNPEMEIVCATTGSKQLRLPERLFSHANVKHVHLKIPNKVWSAFSIIGVVSLFESVEKRCGKADAFFMPNLGFVGRLPKNIPTVLLMHDLSFLIEPRWFLRKQRLWHKAVKATRLIMNATRLLAVSERTKKDAMRLLGIAEEKIDVITIGSTLSVGVGLKPAPTPSRHCLALGLGDPRKNAATAIEAVRMLRREEGFGDVELVVAGAQIIAPWIPQTSVQGVMNHAPTWIHRIPHPTDSELASLYANAAAFLYPSWYEGYGLPLHEAAAFGTPCIASTSGALPETAPPGTIFANPAKPQHWVEGIKLALLKQRSEPQKDDGSWNEAAQKLSQQLR